MMRAVIAAGLMVVSGAARGQSEFDCYERQAARLDDKRSDARTVAAAVVATCHPGRFSTRNGRGELTAAVRAELEKSRTAEIDMATVFVLRGRK
ncbi:hypothetical protein [Bosea minatitlanensis]|uniref:UrcA family protein n=1 Tax=Bosea minatitlanensis TaxID=128782 RepID=A0ABW0EX47_9HYPH|nr:hypothetical protein [Bosea minatitlanensis]MCT4496061.1 hypothetical protein [Bosea minatitlanensis]